MLETIFRVPPIKLRQPDLTWRPSKTLVFAGMLFVFWLITGGIVYDLINEPPVIGTTEGPNGNRIPEGVMSGTRGQYFMEGLTGGFFYTMGGGGLILAHQSLESNWSSGNKSLAIGLGFALIMLAKIGTTAFWSIKMPGYYPTMF